jgi:predicted O-methyltransferase YrrM
MLPYPSTGHAELDHHLAQHYFAVRGMSSRFAAAVAGVAMGAQRAAGIGGHVLEIGCFEGRFTVAMALGLTAGERCLAIDHFEWPSPLTRDAFEANMAAHGVGDGRVITLKADVRDHTVASLGGLLGSGPVRFAHVDGDHAEASLAADLELTFALMHPRGLVLLDDMLHPLYPRLAGTVERALARHPDWRVLAVIDRESLSAAAKFLLCRTQEVAFYEAALAERCADHVVAMRADFTDYFALVLAGDPGLPRFD